MIKATAKKIKDIFELLPVDLNQPGNLNESMKHGLSRMYQDEGIRSYLEHAIQAANHDLLMNADTPEKVIYYRGKIITLMTLLTNAKTWYNNKEDLKKIQLKYATNKEG